ncbi:MAG TPA: hypothetical protein VFM70_11375 [Salinimicrobium sp.]|nr:hypothetical protein [Salinimicrobium sp.]
MKKIFLSLLALTFTLSIFSCRESTGEKTEEAIEAIGEDIEDNAREVGEEIEEGAENLEQEIDEEIHEDDGVHIEHEEDSI